MSTSPPHGGEMHPDGDELLFLVEGAIDIALDKEAGEQVVPLDTGQAFVVPRGIWHRIIVKEPCRLLLLHPRAKRGTASPIDLGRVEDRPCGGVRVTTLPATDTAVHEAARRWEPHSENGRAPWLSRRERAPFRLVPLRPDLEELSLDIVSPVSGPPARASSCDLGTRSCRPTVMTGRPSAPSVALYRCASSYAAVRPMRSTLAASSTVKKSGMVMFHLQTS